MKKLISAFLVSSMILSFVSCGDEEPQSWKKSSSNLSSDAEKDNEEDTTSEDETTEAATEPTEAATSAETTTEAETTAAEVTTVEKTTEKKEETTEKSTKDKDDKKKPDDKNKNDKVDFNDYITVDKPQPALWKASDKKTGNEIYLMGTIHVASDDKYSMPDYVTEVYNSCDKIAFEVDPTTLEDMSSLQELLTYMVYQDGTKISDHVSKKAYEEGKKLLGDMGVYNSILDYYMPGFWLNQIENSAIDKIENISDGVDTRFAKQAKKDGKEIVSIEDLKIQANAMVGYTDEYASYCLEHIGEDINNIDEYAKSLGEIYDLWAEGKIDEMDELTDETDELPEEYHDDYAKYLDIMLYNRNKGMADKAEKYIKNGDDLFFMVGSLHFAGDKGIPKLLEKKGYKVERLH